MRIAIIALSVAWMSFAGTLAGAATPELVMGRVVNGETIEIGRFLRRPVQQRVEEPPATKTDAQPRHR